MRGTAILLIASFLFSSGALEAGTLKWEKWYDDRQFFFDYSAAQSPLGETVQSMVKRNGALTGINGSFFGRACVNGQKNSLFAIGKIECHLTDLSVCPAPHIRGYFWQSEKPEIGFRLPNKKMVFAVHGGIILLLDGKPVKDLQGFSYAFWNRRCLRSIIAIDKTKHRFHLIKYYGSLWECAKYLKKRKMTAAISHDGGSSSHESARVANGFLVFSKNRPFYRQFSKVYFNNVEPVIQLFPVEKAFPCLPVTTNHYFETSFPELVFPWEKGN